MKVALSLEFDTQTLHALFRRELRAAVINRYFQVFGALALLAGIATLLFSEDDNAAGFFVVQIALYFVSLFALLAGISSAQGEREEWPLLLSQPVPRAAYVIGKFAALLAIFGAVMLLLFLPSLFGGTPTSMLSRLFCETLMLAATFLALGLTAGFLAHDRAQALIVGVSAWLFLLVGLDLLALFGARWPLLQTAPDIWASALMLNPLDAFRIEALFALQKIPAEAANKTPLASWWIDHARLWFAIAALGWSAVLISFASHRLNRVEE